jgi:FkbM family methyltransferase
MKKHIKRLLKKMKLYEYLKYSTFFYLYEKFLKPEVEERRKKEISFYTSFLTNCNLIFDIGANDGHKTEAFLLIAQKVVCCEPDETNFRTLEIRFRHQRKRVFLEKVALGSTEKTAEMFIHHPGSAFNTLNEKFKRVTEADDLTKWNEKIQFDAKEEVRLTTLNNLIEKYGYPFFIKIDVEGYELEVIKGLNRPVPFISLECLLPEFAEELNELLGLLIKLDPDSRFNIAVYERLLFEKFVSLTEIKNFLNSFDQNHFELIVKMHSTNVKI